MLIPIVINSMKNCFAILITLNHLPSIISKPCSSPLVSIVFKQLLHLNIVLIRFTKNICEHECGHHPSHEYHWKTQPCQTLLFPNFNLASQHRNLVSIKTMLITLARVISKDSSNIFSVSLSNSTSFSTYTVLSSL